MKVVFLASDGAYPSERHGYRQRALDSWEKAKADWGPGTLEFLWSPPEVEMQRAGYNAMERALDVHDFGIVAFDDVIVAPDVLDYFEWAESRFRDDASVSSISAMQLGKRDTNLSAYYEVQKSPHFICGCWGTWRSRWEQYFKPDYDFQYKHRGFDHQVNDVIFPAYKLNQVFPTWARSQNIGETGEHMRPGMLAEHESHPFAGAGTVPPFNDGWHLKGE